MHFPEWEHDIREVRCREENVLIVKRFWHVWKEVIIVVVHRREDGVSKESEESQVRDDDKKDSHRVVHHHNDLLPGLSHVSDVKEDDEERCQLLCNIP